MTEGYEIRGPCYLSDKDTSRMAESFEDPAQLDMICRGAVIYIFFYQATDGFISPMCLRSEEKQRAKAQT